MSSVNQRKTSLAWHKSAFSTPESVVTSSHKLTILNPFSSHLSLLAGNLTFPLRDSRALEGERPLTHLRIDPSSPPLCLGNACPAPKNPFSYTQGLSLDQMPCSVQLLTPDTYSFAFKHLQRLPLQTKIPFLNSLNLLTSTKSTALSCTFC